MVSFLFDVHAQKKLLAMCFVCACFVVAMIFMQFSDIFLKSHFVVRWCWPHMERMILYLILDSISCTREITTDQLLTISMRQRECLFLLTIRLLIFTTHLNGHDHMNLHTIKQLIWISDVEFSILPSFIRLALTRAETWLGCGGEPTPLAE